MSGPALTTKTEEKSPFQKFIEGLMELDGKLRCPRCGWKPGRFSEHCGLCEGSEQDIVEFYKRHFVR
jgi:hypothetical protein